MPNRPQVNPNRTSAIPNRPTQIQIARGSISNYNLIYGTNGTATFEPLEIYQSYIPFWKAQECGINALWSQGRGCISILCHTSLKMAILLHKEATRRFIMILAVWVIFRPYFFTWIFSQTQACFSNVFLIGVGFLETTFDRTIFHTSVSRCFPIILGFEF